MFPSIAVLLDMAIIINHITTSIGYIGEDIGGIISDYFLFLDLAFVPDVIYTNA